MYVSLSLFVSSAASQVIVMMSGVRGEGAGVIINGVIAQLLDLAATSLRAFCLAVTPFLGIQSCNLLDGNPRVLGDDGLANGTT